MTIQTTKFARKPFYVDAVQVTADNMEEVALWCQGDVYTKEARRGSDDQERYIKVRVHRAMNERQTEAYIGDWVLYAGTGFKVYTPRAFEKSFEKVHKLSKAQADEAGIHPPIEKKPAEKPSPRMLDKGRLKVESVVPLDEKSGELQASQEAVYPTETGVKEFDEALEETRTENREALDTLGAEGDVDYRDAGTGKFVTEEYAEANPSTTVAETEQEEDPAAEAERILAALEGASEDE